MIQAARDKIPSGSQLWGNCPSWYFVHQGQGMFALCCSWCGSMERAGPEPHELRTQQLSLL